MRLTSRDVEIAEVQQMLGVRLRNHELLHAALTHRSELVGNDRESYERLEFLGDAVIATVVSEYLYRKEPDLAEGELSSRRAQLVNRSTLSDVARHAGLRDLPTVVRLCVAMGERAEDSILADMLEAIIGAVFLDRGYRTARAVVNRLLREQYRALARMDIVEDPKSLLQQWTQNRWRELPEYEVSRIESADHRPVFEARVRVHGTVQGTARGPSKKEAERRAARQALAVLHGGSCCDGKHDR